MMYWASFSLSLHLDAEDREKQKNSVNLSAESRFYCICGSVAITFAMSHFHAYVSV